VKGILIALGVCIVSAILEGVLAGRGVSARLKTLKMPSYSPPLAVWAVIGVAYYVICFTVLYRLLAIAPAGALRAASIALLLIIMAINAFWNWVFFRKMNLWASWIAFFPYNVLAAALLLCVLPIDRISAFVFAPYLAYLLYANVWMYRLWRLNREMG